MLRPTAEGLVYSVLSRRFDVIGTLVLLMILSLLQVPCRVAVGDVMTVAGGGAGDGASATTARLSGPTSVVSDGEGNIYIADTVNHRIRKVTTLIGKITTVAGSGNIGAVSGGYSGDNGEATAVLIVRKMIGSIFQISWCSREISDGNRRRRPHSKA